MRRWESGLSLKGRADACAVYVFPLILYRLAVFSLPKARRLVLQRCLSRLLSGGARPIVRRQVCIQRTRNGVLGMPDLDSHWLAERLVYLGWSLTENAVWRRKASQTFPRLQSDPKAESRRKPLGEALFDRECRTSLRKFLGSSDLSRSQKELYRELVVGSARGWFRDAGGRRRRSALTGIGRQDRASWTTPSSRSPGDLHGMRYPFSAWTSERAWQTCPIALAAAVGWKKRLSKPSTAASEFARFGITSGIGRLTSNPNSSCCSTLITS